MVAVELIVLIAAVLAVLVRTAVPFLRKAKEAADDGKELKFDRKYIYTLLLSGVGSVVGGILLFPSLINQIPDGASGLMIFASIFGIAYASNDILNDIVAT